MLHQVVRVDRLQQISLRAGAVSDLPGGRE
jgi:hypothetical protein